MSSRGLQSGRNGGCHTQSADSKFSFRDYIISSWTVPWSCDLALMLGSRHSFYLSEPSEHLSYKIATVFASSSSRSDESCESLHLAESLDAN